MAAKTTIYDALIVGSSIPALCTALRLQQKGQTVLVVEEQEDIGGHNKPISYAGDTYSNKPLFVPETETASLGLDLLKIFLPQLQWQKLEQAPVTFQNGQTQPFLGFGSLSPEPLDLYSYYLTPHRLQLNTTAQEIVDHLKQSLEQETLCLSKITKVEWSDCVELTINGAQVKRGRQLYYFESPKSLARFLTAGQTHKVTKSTTQKLGKSEVWSTLGLLYHHNHELSQSPAMHFLYGAKETICLGQHYMEKEKPFSHWMTTVPAELADDSEHVGSLVKELKRQIKRMFPDFFDKVEKEFIHVQQEAFAMTPTGLITDGRLAKEPRLHVGGHFYGTEPLGLAESLATLAAFEIFQQPETSLESTGSDVQA